MRKRDCLSTMKIDNFSLNLITFDEYESLFDSLKDYDFFFSPNFLRGLHSNFVFAEIRNGLELVALAKLKKRERLFFVDEIDIYDGLLFSEKYKNLKEAKRNIQIYRAFTLINGLLRSEKNISGIKCFPELSDMRAFTSPYDEGNSTKLVIRPCYTYELSLSKKCSIEDLLGEWLPVRRQELKRLEKLGVEVRKSSDVALLLDAVSRSVFEGEKGKRDEYLEYVVPLYNRLEQLGEIEVWGCYGTNQLLSVSMFSTMGRRKYFLYGSSFAEGKSLNSQTLNIFQWVQRNISECTSPHEIVLDFEGANNPVRSWYKGAFGCKLRTYFGIESEVSLDE